MSPPLTFVTWKWRAPERKIPIEPALGKRGFKSEQVNVLYAMIARHYPRPFRLICITDDADGLDPRIEATPIPQSAAQFLSLINPLGERFPNCYCRLWNFSHEAAALLGERIFQIDIDVVITGDLRPLIDRDEDFIGWSDKHFEKNKIAGGAYLLKTGSLKDIWEDFDPVSSPARAFAAGFKGSDQGWMSYKIGNRQRATGNGAEIGYWRDAGLVKLNWTQRGARVPPRGVRLVFTSGVKPPWAKETRAKYPWVREAWK